MESIKSLQRLRLARLLYIAYLVGDEAFQVPRLVLILVKAIRTLFCSVANFNPIICCQFTALELLRYYS